MSLHSDAYPCTLCSEHFPTKTEQANHLSNHHELHLTWLCHECPHAFSDKDDLVQHTATKHSYSVMDQSKGIYACTHLECGFPLTSSSMCERHKKHDHVEQAGKHRGCVKRGCNFSNESYLGMSLHVLHQHGPKCFGCGKVFERWAEIIDHSKGVGGERGCTVEKDVTNATRELTIVPSQLMLSTASTTAKLEGGKAKVHLLPPTYGRYKPPVLFALRSDDSASATPSSSADASIDPSKLLKQSETLLPHAQPQPTMTTALHPNSDFIALSPPSSQAIPPQHGQSTSTSSRALGNALMKRMHGNQSYRGPPAELTTPTTQQAPLMQPYNFYGHFPSNKLFGSPSNPQKNAWHNQHIVPTIAASKTQGSPQASAAVLRKPWDYDSYFDWDPNVPGGGHYPPKDISTAKVGQVKQPSAYQYAFQGMDSSSALQTQQQPETLLDGQLSVEGAITPYRPNSRPIHHDSQPLPSQIAPSQAYAPGNAPNEGFVNNESTTTNGIAVQKGPRLTTTPAQQPVVSAAYPPLPQSVLDKGYTDVRFNPQTPWTDTVPNRRSHEHFPDDLDDIHIFRANPKFIAYGNILNLATRYSNVEIFRRVNEGRKDKAFNSPQVVDSRIQAALRVAAEEWNSMGNLQEAEEWLATERAKHGIVTRKKKRAREDAPNGLPTSTGDGDQPTTTPNKRVKIDQAVSPPPAPPRTDTYGLMGYPYHRFLKEDIPNPHLPNNKEAEEAETAPETALEVAQGADEVAHPPTEGFGETKD